MQNSLRYYRKRKGLTQRQVAGALGLKDSSRICDWEVGRKLPNLKYALMLAALFKCPLIVLYSDLHNQYWQRFHKKSYMH
ncbi:helix-turn-helix transcriptional regulator [candidate division WOR-3 bacterium]|nr:helix-turn-helix transcriptional regulator [candidate division WOR-3 bacterium]